MKAQIVSGSDYYSYLVCAILSVGGIGGAAYILHSLLQLMTYHKNLTITSTLTKEDSGADNASISGPFSFFVLKQNILLNMKGIK